MDPLNDCPICFETYAVEGEAHDAVGGQASQGFERHIVPCCEQHLCKTCFDSLRRCPFCRKLWHGEDEDEEGLVHPWVRTPVLALVTATTLAPEVVSVSIATARALAVGAASALAEASPAVVAGSCAGVAALAGGAAIFLASQHSDAQSQRLQEVIQERPRQGSFSVPWQEIARRLWDVLDWHLSPQKKGMPHVYHGSLWRSRKQEDHLARLATLRGDSLASAGAAAASGSSSSREGSGGYAAAVPTADAELWGDLLFCFTLWLQYNPHTANWGTCSTYGLSPLHLCWHNRWREDLRHALTALVARMLRESRALGVERSCAFCLLGMLDHVLSWKVATPNFGSSDLLDCYTYANFSAALKERFAFAWGAAQAPEDADIELEGFDEHVQLMAERGVPDEFRSVW